MTPDIIKAIADVLDQLNALNYHGHLDHDYIEDEDIAEAVDNLCARGDDLSEALGLVRDSSWEETAARLRALARPDVGLPEGWTMHPRTYHTDSVMHSAIGPNMHSIALFMCHDGRAYWECIGKAPPAVYSALLRAAGVAS